jgi:ABC-type nickel/cobalt efflux system permease component RcnA
MNWRRIAVGALVVGAAVMLALPTEAQSSLGIGRNEAVVQPSGPFASLMVWINTIQRGYYRDMTEALKAMRDSGAAAWTLVGLSLLYGIFHAAGPGHGKAVISSYMLANEVTLRRGIVISFVSAMLQAVSAIALVGAAYAVLRGTTISMTEATRAMEIASYALILAFGLWLLWSKLRAWLPVNRLQVATTGHGHDHHHHVHHHEHHGHHHHGPEAACDTCGHVHAVEPSSLAGRFSWKSAFAAVMAVGLRPCSGALIVLTFAFLNGLVLAGVMSAFAMAIGTGTTVAILALLAVKAKTTALRFASGNNNLRWLHGAIEIGGALFVTLIGALLLAAALSG